jgi:hypothetical protein
MRSPSRADPDLDTGPPLRERLRGAVGHAAGPPALAALGLLVLSWPFVRSPPLEIAAAFAHFFAWWALLVAALGLGSWALRRAGRTGDRGRDDP